MFFAAYVFVVHVLAALVVAASISWQDTRRPDDSSWALPVARSYCRYRSSGVPEATSRDRAIRDQLPWPEPLVGGPHRSPRWMAAAIAELCPRFRLGAGPARQSPGRITVAPAATQLNPRRAVARQP